MDREISNIVVERIDGEVTAQRVLFDIAPHVVPQQQAIVRLVSDMVAVLVLGFTTEGGHLDDFAAKAHVNDAEAAANQA